MLFSSNVLFLTLPFVSALLNSGAGYETRKEDKIFQVGKAGEPHGKGFSDKALPTTRLHYRPDSITLYGCNTGEHFSGYLMSYRDNVDLRNGKAYSLHGTKKGSSKEAALTLEPDEYFTTVTVTTWKKVVYKHPIWNTYRTRTGSIKLETNKNKSVQCGASDDEDQVYTFDKQDHAFLFFEGSSGDAIDQLVTWFVPVNDY